MSTKRIIAGSVFAIAAAVPASLVLHEVLGRPKVILLYMIAPMICAFISAYLLGDKINYDQGSTVKSLGRTLAVSGGIVVLSLVLWIIPAVIMLPLDEKYAAPGIALFAGSMFAWATFPPGLVAGLIVWRLAKG
jgi:peptidoglycan biosynthesis protein MviN/MurJ (putative lipid II flippase)